MKKSFLHSLAAALYIVIIVLSVDFFGSALPEENIVMPMVMLSLLVLSVSVMGILFLYEPVSIYIEGRRKEAIIFFVKTVGFFACFVALFLILLFLV